VRGSLHLMTYLNLLFNIAGVGPIITLNETYEGKSNLSPTVQFISVADDATTAHCIPSMKTVGVATSKYYPVIEISYPPKTSPLSGVTLLTIGVLSFL